MKKKSVSYVMYEYARIYKPDKKYNVPQRSIIGKVSANDPSVMYPNEKYQDYFPDAVFPEVQNWSKPV